MAMSDFTPAKPARTTRVRSLVSKRVSKASPGTIGAFAFAYRAGTLKNAVVEEARHSGLLEGEKSEHVSFRVPPALLEAAKRETGITSTSELGVLALAMLAQPDPVAAFMKKTRGRLGKDHTLDC